jgi:hypothetical protein
MRTTVELPSELMRAAKARAAQSGESLKRLFTRAVEAELGATGASGSASARVSLPLFGSTSGTPVSLTNADLENALAAGEARTARTSGSRGRRSRKP